MALKAPLVDIDNEFSGRELRVAVLKLMLQGMSLMKIFRLRSFQAPDASLWEIFLQGVETCSNL